MASKANSILTERKTGKEKLLIAENRAPFFILAGGYHAPLL
jgi:hypothetical protein